MKISLSDKQPEKAKLIKLRKQFLQALEHGILPFWLKYSVDVEHGGFYGRVDNEGQSVPEAHKALVLNTRILWSFSAAYSIFGHNEYLKMANRASDYIHKYFIDTKFGGVFWMLGFQGSPIEDKKKVYGHAFLIYALTEYFRATGNQADLDLAIEIFEIIEKNFFDRENGGYFEATRRDWTIAHDMRLSAVDLNEKKSMNAHLHILEAYTNLLRVWNNSRLKKQLTGLANDFLHNIMDSKTGHFNLFFNEYWEAKSPWISLGHDIEGSWLLWESAELIDDPDLKNRIRNMSIKQADAVYEKGLNPDSSLTCEIYSDGRKNMEKHWWVQAEAMVGFLNAYQLSGNNKFFDAMIGVWNYIHNNLIDKKIGEWFYKRNEDGSVARDEFKISEWKGPYHNSRACLELVRRLEKLIS
ncbi:AGE family epimerase/isomerase [Thermodesulfobacteriota bacterium]